MKTIWILVYLSLGAAMGAQQPNENPRELLKQYVADLQKNPSDDALREKIIKLALQLEPMPIVPREAKEHEGAAEYAFKHAQGLADIQNAASEYEKALMFAPWVAGDYFNLGVCYEKAGAQAKAIAAYQLYLMAAPNAKDTDGVVKQIGALKYQLARQRAAEQDRMAAVAEAERQRQYQAQLAREHRERYRLEGTWRQVAKYATMVRFWHNDQGWQATFLDDRTGNPMGDPIRVEDVTGNHIVLSVDEIGGLTNAVWRWELDLSADGNSLQGRYETFKGSLADWERQHRKEWVQIAFVRQGQ